MTGTRWTTFTQLPDAFSGGSRLKRAPVPALMESTRPAEQRSGKVSTRIGRRLPGADPADLRLLEIRDHPDALERDDGEKRLADLDHLARFDGLLRDHARGRGQDAGLGTSWSSAAASSACACSTLAPARPAAASLTGHLGLLGLGVGHQRLGLFDAPLGLLDGQRPAARLHLRGLGVALRLGQSRRRGGVQRGDRRAVSGTRRVELLLGDEAPAAKPAGAVEIEPRPIRRGLGERRRRPARRPPRRRGGCGAGTGLVLLRASDVDGDPGGGESGPRLLDTALGALAGERDLGVRTARLGARHGDRGAGLLDADLGVARVDLDQKLALADVSLSRTRTLATGPATRALITTTAPSTYASSVDTLWRAATQAQVP